MDKNRKKSDLLAAGRKKLEQFRQKRENKGVGHGKLLDKGAALETGSPSQLPHAEVTLASSTDEKLVKLDAERSLSEVETSPLPLNAEHILEPVQGDEPLNQDEEVVHPERETAVRAAPLSQDTDAEVAPAASGASDVQNAIDPVQDTRPIQLGRKEMVHPEDGTDSSGIRQEQDVTSDYPKEIHDRVLTVVSFSGTLLEAEASEEGCRQDSMADEVRLGTISSENETHSPGLEHEQPMDDRHLEVSEGDSVLGCSQILVAAGARVGNLEGLHREGEINPSGLQDDGGSTCAVESMYSNLDDQEVQISGLDQNTCAHVDGEEFRGHGGPPEGDDRTNNELSKDVDHVMLADATTLQLVQEEKQEPLDEAVCGVAAVLSTKIEGAAVQFPIEAANLQIEKNKHGKHWTEDVLQDSTMLPIDAEVKTDHLNEVDFNRNAAGFVSSSQFWGENSADKSMLQEEDLQENQDAGARCLASETELSETAKDSLLVSSDLQGSSVLATDGGMVSPVIQCEDGAYESSYIHYAAGPERSCSSDGALLKIVEELYIRSIIGDVLQVQLQEQSLIQLKSDEQDEQLLNEVSKLRSLLNVAHGSSASITEEFAQCRSELMAMTVGKEGLETQLFSARNKILELENRIIDLQKKLELSEEEISQELRDLRDGNKELNTQLCSTMEKIEELTLQNCDLQNKLVKSDAQLCQLTEDLASSKELISVLETTNGTLTRDLLAARDQLGVNKLELTLRKKREDDLVSENSKITAELLEVVRRQTSLEDDLREAMSYIEELLEENFCLSCSLDVHRDKAAEDLHLSSTCEGSGMTMIQKSSVLCDDKAKPDHVEKEHGAEYDGFGSLKEYLEDALMTIKRLEKSIQNIGSDNASFVRFSSKSASGISKIIQAFEAKSLSEETFVEEVSSIVKPTIGDQSKIDKKADVNQPQDASSSTCLRLAKEELHRLQCVLKQVGLDLVKASHLFMEEQRCKEAALGALRNLQAEHVAKKQENSDLEAQVNVLLRSNEKNMKKLLDYDSLTYDLHVRLDELHHSFCHTADMMVTQVECLQKEVDEKMSILELESSFIYAEIFSAVEKLRECTNPVSFISNEPSDLAVSMRLSTAVSAAVETIMDLHRQLLASYIEGVVCRLSLEELKNKHVLLHERNQSAVLLLDRTYSNVMKVINDFCGLEQSVEENLNFEKLQIVLPKSCEILTVQLHNFLNERSVLHSTKVELESKLFCKAQEIEELKKVCSGKDEPHSCNNSDDASDPVKVTPLDVSHPQLLSEKYASEGTAELGSQLDEETHRLVRQLIEAVEKEVLPEQVVVDMRKHPLEYLDTLIFSLLEKYKKITEQLNLLKKCIGDFSTRPELLDECNMVPLHVMLKEEFESKLVSLRELQETIHQLNSIKAQLEVETQNLKEGLAKVGADLDSTCSELRNKDLELVQSEQRVTSVKEKLSIAVAKGKGLIVQRDALKQSLAEKTSDLEKCWKELQSKSTSLHEAEAKLKVYSEAGERIEALESELSYIRNSATTLRESFLQKDSVLQRIEEILDELELPDQFNFGDVTEKIEWLVRSISGNPVLTDWDQKSSVGEAGFVASDPWKEDSQSSLNPAIDDLKRKYEELQSRFYGLAEQNDMLEQSLMERNSLVQRWEEVMDKIDIPPNLQSVELEERIDWLRKTLWEAQHDRDAFREKIESLVESSSAIMVDLEESRNKISNLEAALGTVTHEKELLAGRLEKLAQEHEQLLEKVLRDELEKENFHKEVFSLQEKIHEQKATNNEYCSSMEKEIELLQEKIEEQNCAHEKYSAALEDEIKKLQALIDNVLLNHDIKGNFSDGSYIDSLREHIKMLLDSYRTISLENSVLRDKEKQEETEQANIEMIEDKATADMTVMMETDSGASKRELDEALSALSLVKEERDQICEQYESLVIEVQELGRQKKLLEEQLSQEEQKCTSTREKLGVAVRKGKALVQQRDQLKQTLEETNSEMERLKIEVQKCNDALVECEQKIQQLLGYQGKCEALESENVVLRNKLEETEDTLDSNICALNEFLTALNAVSIISKVTSTKPLQKLEQLVKVVHDLEAQCSSCEQDAKRSKHAAELLVAELNDVQERYENLQEELIEKESIIGAISAQRDAAEAAKSEALLHLEQTSKSVIEDRKNQHQKELKLNIGLEQLNEACYALHGLLTDGFSRELEMFGSVEASLVAFLKKMVPIEIIEFPVEEARRMVPTSDELHEEMGPLYMKLKEHQLDECDKDHDIHDFESVSHGLHACIKMISWVQNRWLKQISNLSESSERLIKIIENGEKRITSSTESLASLKRYVSDLEGRKKEEDAELDSLRKLIMILYEACSSSVFEIKNHLLASGRPLASGVQPSSTSGIHAHKEETIQLATAYTDKGGTVDQDKFILSEEVVISMADDLLSTIKDSTKKWFEMIEEGQKELKATISCLREEIQEKEIQKKRICEELVSQIKEAEATANKYLVDLHCAKANESDLEEKVKLLEHAHEMLQLRVNDLTSWETSSKELEKKVESINNLLGKKDQEIDGLIQALDEEEVQMEDMAKKVEDLEKIVQEKNYAIESLEASRAKAVAKLSSTLRKFDELHHFSENLLSEIENFQVQLQGRDEEISFLRQEVTQYTNDLLTVQENNKRSLTMMHEISMWLDGVVSRLGMQELNPDDVKNDRLHSNMEILDAHISSLVSELDGLRLAARTSDSLLLGERNKVDELQKKVEMLENSIKEKDSQLQLVSGTWEAGVSTSDALEVESVRNKKVVTLGPTVSHARNIRKIANDHLLIDMEAGSSLVDVEEDDKSHGFKSLATSSIVPRITRPLVDRIDGLWVSGERLLMRQPTLRLGFIVYWVVMHVLFAAAIV
ncbi:trans-Golgi network-localized SYP41-interacting protein 1 isoform X2 [Nymphaea colorata]|uniref:trans-Golgi network-localized SYP41-interacting protein 1 isoform X2 n=1 Tax=Nymphaea colorata TaxID=210225 RepID=UPI00129E89A5|nr:trans-Golgi network-localized SYP41-interacting protein 1 isoform X2 [Nymphaea colorata]